MREMFLHIFTLRSLKLASVCVRVCVFICLHVCVCVHARKEERISACKRTLQQ